MHQDTSCLSTKAPHSIRGSLLSVCARHWSVGPQLIDVQKEQAAEDSCVEKPGMTRDAIKDRGKLLGFLGTLGVY